MNEELRRARSRQMFIFLLVCIGIAGLIGRLYYWQILQSGHLSKLADGEHIQKQIVNAPRGLIYDYNGRLLAANVVRDDVYIEPYQFIVEHPEPNGQRQADLAHVVYSLHQVLPNLSEDNLEKAFHSGRQTIRIAGPIEPQQSEKLREMQLKYTFLEPRTWRIYPGATLAAQVLGFVQNGEFGVYGIEGKYNKILAGKPGRITAETDLNGNPLIVDTGDEQLAVPGANLKLTIDSTVQYMVQNALNETVKKLGAQGGSVIILHARTGAIVAMSGAPTFDPNTYGKYAEELGCLGYQSVYFNPALSCAYEPGSTMKTITMAAALDQGLITPDTTVQDPGFMTFADAPTVNNWDKKDHGSETMTQVLEHSSNVGAAYVAHDILGPERYYSYLKRFGFGELTGLSGPEEPGFYRSHISDGWTPSDLTRQAFGQSIQVTPFQIAMAYQAIANGGVMMQPYLVASVDTNGQVTRTQPQIKRTVISAKTAEQLTQMLVSAANFNEQATFPGYSVAVKTGTATTQGLADDQTEASVAGFLPASNPQYVILVKLDRPQAAIHGGTAAAPLWKTIAQQLMWHYGILPDQP